jgi:hypothetical protein
MSHEIRISNFRFGIIEDLKLDVAVVLTAHGLSNQSIMPLRRLMNLN